MINLQQEAIASARGVPGCVRVFQGGWEVSWFSDHLIPDSMSSVEEHGRWVWVVSSS